MDYSVILDDLKNSLLKLIMGTEDVICYKAYRISKQNLAPYSPLSKFKETVLIATSTEKTNKDVNSVKVEEINKIDDEDIQDKPLELTLFKGHLVEDQHFQLSEYDSVPFGEAKWLVSMFSLLDFKENCCFCVAINPLGNKRNAAIIGIKRDNDLNKNIPIFGNVIGPILESEIEKCDIVSEFYNFAKNKDISCIAKYEILNEYCVNSTMTVETNWSELCSILSSPKSATASVMFKPVLNKSENNPLFKINQEIFMLQQFVTVLKTKKINWNKESLQVPISMQINNLLNSKHIEKLEDKIKCIDKLEDCILMLNDRSDLDFCDELWIILSKCTSFADLKTVFSTLFKALESGKFRPFVHKHNSSRLARMIKDSLESDFSYSENLNTRELTTMTIEIGLEKLAHDYMTLYTDKKFAMDSHLEPYVKKLGSYETRMDKLFKLHTILETVFHFKKWLDASYDVLSTVSETLLKRYLSEPINLDTPINIVIPKSGLRIDCNPTIWTCTCKDEEKNISKTLYVSIKAPFDHVYQANCQEEKLSYYVHSLNF